MDCAHAVSSRYGASITQAPLGGSTFSPSDPPSRLILCSADVTDRAALLQNKVETLIGCQAE